MVAFLLFLLNLLDLSFKSKSQLAAENAALRQQVIVLQRKVRGQAETLLRWHREGFRRYWRWKSRNCGGRPPISAELRALIRRMSLDDVAYFVQN
jgi:hypothetical protein